MSQRLDRQLSGWQVPFEVVVEQIATCLEELSSRLLSLKTIHDPAEDGKILVNSESNALGLGTTEPLAESRQAKSSSIQPTPKSLSNCYRRSLYAAVKYEAVLLESPPNDVPYRCMVHIGRTTTYRSPSDSCIRLRGIAVIGRNSLTLYDSGERSGAGGTVALSVDRWPGRERCHSAAHPLELRRSCSASERCGLETIRRPGHLFAINLASKIAQRHTWAG